MTTTAAPEGRSGHIPFFVPLLNPLMARFLRAGIPLGAPMYLLTTRGRTSGRDRTTPVAVFDHDGSRYLFSTFGETHWVRNLRAAGRAHLARRGESFDVTAAELAPERAGPILRGALRHYLATPMRAFLARYYAATADGPDRDFVELAARHPVFRIAALPTSPNSVRSPEPGTLKVPNPDVPPPQRRPDPTLTGRRRYPELRGNRHKLVIVTVAPS